MKHLSIRVAWHDNKWDGSVCNSPKENTYCISLRRIYGEKQDEESDFAGENWSRLKPSQLPPCKAEGGAFLNKEAYKRLFTHPYKDNKKAQHGHLEQTEFEVPSYTTFSVPFWWMLRKNQKTICEEYPDLPRDEKPPFPSPWVYGNEPQEALSQIFYSQLESKKSLVFFYTKSGNPVDENSKRLLIGVGTIDKINHILRYKTSGTSKSYPIWDRMITHSIRPNDSPNYRGFIIPYHEYLDLAENFKIEIDGKEKNKNELLDEIKVPLFQPGSDEALFDAFSYVSQLLTNRQVLFILANLRRIVENIKQHGIVEGAWEKKLIWLNEQIGLVKEMMGPYPSFSNALVAIGFNQGHLFAQDIYDDGICDPKGNPWEVLIQVINGNIKLNRNSFNIADLTVKWRNLEDKERDLLILLSRFELTSKQIKSWFDPDERQKKNIKATMDEIISNPYVIAEEDIGDRANYPVAVETIDLGVFADKEIQGSNVPQPPILVESDIDPRRIRALSVQILKEAAVNGDTLLSWYEIRQRLAMLNYDKSTEIPPNYIKLNLDFYNEKLTHIKTENENAMQLKIYDEIDRNLNKIFKARATRELDILNEDWRKLIVETAKDSGVAIDQNNPRHKAALEDQVKALELVTSRKLSVLHGPAGTGKTTVMGALFRSKKLQAGGILLLAPTGKARVKLATMAKSSAFTIAQLLTKLKRFDWETMKPRFYGKEKYKGEKTIIIDECSMLTEDDFYALFQALDLAYVERIILVGDPYQLPPIGAGRPFADLCSYLEICSNSNDLKIKKAYGALAILEVVVRTAAGKDSDILMLASWFAGKKPPKNADLVISKLNDNSQLNDLRVETWSSQEYLEEQLKRVLAEELNLEAGKEAIGFSKVLGFENNLFNINEPESVEKIQLLSPVKNPFWGTLPLNRFIQQNYRDRYMRYWENPLGDQQIWKGDKVIQLVNEKREGYSYTNKCLNEFQLSNGQIGYVVNCKNGYANVCYSGLPNHTFGYNNRDFGEDGGLIELAYIITVHKSQGSDFQTVILIIPRKGRIISRELIYTALTRAKKRLVLLVEGDDPHWIINYSKPEASDTARRNTCLFETNIRDSMNSIPHVENLIHKTKDGKYVRSKSEVIIANMLVDAGLTEYEYEKPFETNDGKRLPDFTLVDAAGDTIILEHLGMLHKESYREEWERKRLFYEHHGIKEGENLFTTQEDEKGAIDSKWIYDNVIRKLQDLIL